MKNWRKTQDLKARNGNGHFYYDHILFLFYSLFSFQWKFQLSIKTKRNVGLMDNVYIVNPKVGIYKIVVLELAILACIISVMESIFLIYIRYNFFWVILLLVFCFIVWNSFKNEIDEKYYWKRIKWISNF